VKTDKDIARKLAWDITVLWRNAAIGLFGILLTVLAYFANKALNEGDTTEMRLDTLLVKVTKLETQLEDLREKK
jgi:hypothetical protein